MELSFSIASGQDTMLQTKSEPDKRASSNPKLEILQRRKTTKSLPYCNDDGQDYEEYDTRYQLQHLRRQKIQEMRQLKYDIAEFLQRLEEQKIYQENLIMMAVNHQKEGKYELASICRKAIAHINDSKTLVRQIDLYKKQIKEIQEWCLSHRT